MSTKSLHQRMVARYWEYRDATVPLQKKWNGWDGKAIREIKDYLLRLTGEDEDKAYAGWDYILSNIDKGTPFHQRISYHPHTFKKYVPEIVAYLNPYGKLGKTKQQQSEQSREDLRRAAAQRLANRGCRPPAESRPGEGPTDAD